VKPTIDLELTMNHTADEASVGQIEALFGAAIAVSIAGIATAVIVLILGSAA
jgi:hypothetical protein